MSPPVVPINSLQRHFSPYGAELARAATAVIDSGHYVMGPGVLAFEQAFADFCGVPQAVSVANGTDALELCLRALGVEAGHRVAVCANAAMYSTTATLACGAEPLFVDILPERQGMDPARLEAALDAHTDTSAVILTHLYGRLGEVEAIGALCRERGVRLVEDCAQAHGARGRDGRRAGAYGDLASFSFYPTKNLGALGDGGAVTSSDEVLAGRVRQLRQYGWADKYTNELPGGRNSRLDEIQARMLLALLPHVEEWNLRRRAVAQRYSNSIRNDSIQLPAVAGDDDVAHLYVVRCDRRAELQAHLQGAGIQTDVHYPRPDHRQPCHAGRFDSVSLPVTEAEAGRVLSLPCFPELEPEEVQRVIDACNAF